MQAAIDQALCELLKVSDISYQPIAGQHTHANFCITAAGQHYFLKCFRVNQLYPYTRERCIELQAALAQQGFAPKPLHYNPALGFQLDEWHAPTTHTLSLSDKLQWCGEFFAKLHQTTVSAPVTDLTSDWQHYRELAQAASTIALQTRLQDCATLYASSNEFCLCHNDLALNHCCFASAHTVYDWEYAGLGNRYFDLAAFVRLNQLDAKATNHLLQSYTAASDGQSRISMIYVAERVKQQEAVVDLTFELWFNAQQQCLSE